MSHLTLEQRYEIATLKGQKFSQKKIADIVGRDKSVISRELRRNADGRSRIYKADLAQKKSNERHQNKPKNTRFTSAIKDFVKLHLKNDLSPEQIEGIALRLGMPCVSKESIYQFVWADKKAKGMLYLHLRTKGKRYTKRGNLNGKRGHIADRVDISQRPQVVNDKKRIGDIEMDLVIGKNHKGALLTINDRTTGMLKMAKINSKEAHVVEHKAIELLQDWKPHLHTITTDNGKEFANHKNIAQALNIDYFFATPYHSWERGANENLNGLIRQYFPKKYDFDLITNEKITEIENKLNNRPRKRFGYKSPLEVHCLKIQSAA